MPITHNVQLAVFKKLSVRLDSANLAHQDKQLNACLTLSKCFCLCLQIKHTPNSVAYSALDLLTDLFKNVP